MENKSDIVTKIEVQKNNKNRVNVFINEDYAFACSLDLVYLQHLKVNMEINSEQLQEIVREDNFIKSKNDALKVIEKSYKTEKEMRDKLLLKGYDENIIERCMEFLKEYNFINDSNYASMYIKDKIKQEGANKIKYSLLRKGIPHQIINEKLEVIYNEDENENNSVFAIAEKKYNSLIKSENDNIKIYRKLRDYLYRKGYLEDEIRSALKNVIKDDLE